MAGPAAGVDVSAPPRAVGVRLAYERVPAPVRDWVDATLGSPVRSAATQAGGMSPGCAARLVTADGRRAFCKAVGPELNPDTCTMFRHEMQVLRHLPDAPYRPRVLAGFDDGAWVGLLLEDVDGAHPDLRDADTFTTVARTVVRQAIELTPAPAGLNVPALRAVAQRWAASWQAMRDDPAPLPPWAGADVRRLAGRAAAAPGLTGGDTLCHVDLRNDNLLVRPDGSVVVLDWGMARLGPAWFDVFVLALEQAERPGIDSWLAEQPLSRDVPASTVTTLLLALGGHLLRQSMLPAAPGLPMMPAFRRTEGTRFLAGARRRLDQEDTT